jgi:hypothetical protein
VAAGGRRTQCRSRAPQQAKPINVIDIGRIIMDENKKYIYAKFKMGKDPDVMENMFISESRQTVDEWKAEKRKDTSIAKDKDEDNGDVYSFRSVSMEFETSLNTFQITVPFIMNIIPIARRIYDDNNIRKTIAEQGEQLEKGEFELYRVSLDRSTSITRRLEESAAIGQGINSIPRLFMMGLVSAYDSFLSQLIRCIFVTRPELLSSSERNISLKELTEIGSVEEARERIIDKEVESVIRDSHSQQIDWLERKLNMPLRKDLKIWPEFIEICERRNLLSHNNGEISAQYMAVCREHNVDTGYMEETPS